MIKAERILAVIPARGGSLGVSRKNIKMLNGLPLIVHTIKQTDVLSELDEIVVSTDDAEISNIARAHGCRVVARPPELATAEAKTESALLHTLDVLEANGDTFDYIVTLEPTSPFRTPELIRRSIEKIVEAGANSLLGVREVHEITGTIDDEGFFRAHLHGQARRRQDRMPSYAEASTIYVCRVDWLRRTHSLVSEDWLSIIVSSEEAVDINTLEDFEYCEFLMQKRTKKS